MMTSLLPAKRSSSFLLVFLLILCTLAIQGCIPIATGIPAVDTANIAVGAVVLTIGGISEALDDDPDIDPDIDPYIDPDDLYQFDLRQGEELLLYSRSPVQGYRGYDRRLLITNERVLYWIADNVQSLSTQHWLPPESVDHIDIRQIELYKITMGGKHQHTYRLRLHLYGGLETKDFYYEFTSISHKEKITQAIQTQVDYINMIRMELGISIPVTITTSEMVELNEPVISELRARRQIK